MSTELLTTFEVARILKTSVFYVRHLIRNGRLKAIRVGKGWRIREEDLALFLAELSGKPLVATAEGRQDDTAGDER